MVELSTPHGFSYLAYSQLQEVRMPSLISHRTSEHKGDLSRVTQNCVAEADWEAECSGYQEDKFLLSLLVGIKE